MDLQYRALCGPADEVVNGLLRRLARDQQRLIEEAASRGFDSLQGTTIAALEDTALKYLKQMCEELFDFYPLECSRIPGGMSVETRTSLDASLARHIAEQFDCVRQSHVGFVVAHGGRTVEGKLDQDIAHYKRQAERMVASL